MKLIRKILPAFIIVLIMTIFMIYLNTYSFKEKIDNLSVQRDSVVLNGVKVKIEYSLANGKENINYFGIDKLIDNLKAYYNDCDGMILIDNENNLIYSTYTNDEVRRITKTLGEIDKSDDEYSYIQKKDKLISKIDIKNKVNDKVATLINIVNTSYNTQIVKQYFKSEIYVFLAGIIVLFTILIIYLKKSKAGALFGKFVVALLLIFQTLTLLISFVKYENMIVNHINYTFDNMSYSISNNFNKIIENSIDIDDVSGVDSYIGYIESSVDAIEKYDIQKYYENGEVKYEFDYKVSQVYIKKILKNNIIDAVTIFIISIFFFIEISNIIKTVSGNDGHVDYNKGLKIRSLSFFLFIAYNLSTFFVPIQMMNIINHSGSPLSLDMMVGIPTSVEALMIAVSSILSGAIIDKKGCKTIFIHGCIILAGGFILSYISSDAYVFILSRAIAGIGYGLCLINIRTMAANCDEDQISNVIAGINASAYAAVNIGSIVGGYIGEYFGVNYTFLVSAILCMAGYVFCKLKISNEIIITTKEKLSAISIFKRFICEKKLIMSVILVLLPISIVTSFIDYFYPVYASGTLMLKLTEISRGYLLNGLIIVLVGVLINKAITKYFSMKYRFISAGLLFGLALVLFGYVKNIFGLYGAIILISLAMTYAGGSFIEYYMSFEVVKEIGLAKSMSFYTLFDKAGAYLAPIIYGFILVKNTQLRLIILGIYTLISIYLFSKIFSKGTVENDDNT